MIKPKIIIHNSISLDGALIDFQVHMDFHYKLAHSFHPQAHIIGSHTIEDGIKKYGNLSDEIEEDQVRPIRDESLPYWMIIDSHARLQGLLHEVRRFELNRDIIVFVSSNTPQSYINYLDEREYRYHMIGGNHVDIDEMLDFIGQQYKVDTVLTDTGRVLSNLLLKKGLVSEISILVHPELVGLKGYYMFSDIEKNITLKLSNHEILDGGYVWLVYQVVN